MERNEITTRPDKLRVIVDRFLTTHLHKHTHTHTIALKSEKTTLIRLKILRRTKKNFTHVDGVIQFLFGGVKNAVDAAIEIPSKYFAIMYPRESRIKLTTFQKINNNKGNTRRKTTGVKAGKIILRIPFKRSFAEYDGRVPLKSSRGPNKLNVRKRPRSGE